MGTGDAGLRRFSNMQWYLAQAQNRVHLAAVCTEAVTSDEFGAIVMRVLAEAPQLGWRIDLQDDGFYNCAPVALSSVAHFALAPPAGWRMRDIDALLAEPLPESAPAFRARCISAPDAEPGKVRAWVLFEGSHALTEGGDIGAILRGRGAVHDSRPVVDVPVGGWRRTALAVALPLLWALHLGASFAVRRRAVGMRTLRLSLGRAEVAAAARGLQVSQRALLFGLVISALFGARGSKRARHIAYSSLPKARARLHDDTFLNVRMDEFKARLTGAPAADVQATAAAIFRRGPMPLGVQAWHNALLGLHRRLHKLFPGLYRHGFFDFSPYDMVLSLVPQVRPGTGWGPLAGATCFAGSNTGATPNCIYAVGERQITLSLWLPPDLAARQDALVQAAVDLGIAAEVWD